MSSLADGAAASRQARSGQALAPDQIDDVANALLVLARELWVVKDRQRVLEALLAENGIVARCGARSPARPGTGDRARNRTRPLYQCADDGAVPAIGRRGVKALFVAALLGLAGAAIAQPAPDTAALLARMKAIPMAAAVESPRAYTQLKPWRAARARPFRRQRCCPGSAGGGAGLCRCAEQFRADRRQERPHRPRTLCAGL